MADQTTPPLSDAERNRRVDLVLNSIRMNKGQCSDHTAHLAGRLTTRSEGGGLSEVLKIMPQLNLKVDLNGDGRLDLDFNGDGRVDNRELAGVLMAAGEEVVASGGRLNMASVQIDKDFIARAGGEYQNVLHPQCKLPKASPKRGG